MQREVYVDGKPVLVDDTMSGEKLFELVNCPTDHFPVISRRNDNRFDETIPVSKRNPYQMQDGDRVSTLYHVDSGGGSIAA